MRNLTELELRNVAGGEWAWVHSICQILGNTIGEVEAFFGSGSQPMPSSCTPAAQRSYIRGYEQAGSVMGAMDAQDAGSSLQAILDVTNGTVENRQDAVANINQACGKSSIVSK